MKLKLVKSGTVGFDKLLGGGIPRGTAVLVQSDGAGAEAEKFCIQFVAECLKNNGGAFIVCASMHYGELKAELASADVNLKICDIENRLKIIDWYSYKFERIRGGLNEEGMITKCSIDLTNVGIAINNCIKKLKKLKKIGKVNELRAYIDVIDNALKIYGIQKTYEFTEAIVGLLQKNGFTSVFLLKSGSSSGGSGGALKNV